MKKRILSSLLALNIFALNAGIKNSTLNYVGGALNSALLVALKAQAFNIATEATKTPLRIAATSTLSFGLAHLASKKVINKLNVTEPTRNKVTLASNIILGFGAIYSIAYQGIKSL